MKYACFAAISLCFVGCSNFSKRDSNDRIIDLNGRVIAVYSQGKLRTFVYGPDTGQIEKSVSVDVASKAVLTVDYFYEKGKLIRAEKSTGETISLVYDVSDRISKLITTGDVIDIQYNKEFNKPSLLQKSDGSAIRIHYKSNGDIERVEKVSGEFF